MRLAILTTGRQDWGILHSTYLLLKPEVIRWKNPGGKAYCQSADAALSIGDQLEHAQPDALLVVGDRYETLSAALTATTLKIPLIHLHGGETTEGAFDNQIRDAVTKLSHLHLVSSEQHRKNVIRMGEEAHLVHVVGAPGTDNAFRADLPSHGELERRIGYRLDPPVNVCIVHPTTLGGDVSDEAIRVMGGLQGSKLCLLPNHDPGHEAVREKMQAHFPCVESLDEREYWGLLKHTAVLVGNSSSLVVEAPALGINVILLGDRQKGRTPPMPADGKCAERIRDVLASWSPPNPPRKRLTALGG